ncbi:MAG: long-chain-fatty-acid--CoA ligase, partial [Gammaproteobacteria bacterium]|nr:long-chain-fatty-acid--CoA ligase [Gammaproteobacteria bacterium]
MKPWYKNYPEGAAHDIDMSIYSSLADLFRQTVDNYQDNTAAVSFGSELSFNELDTLSRDFAAFLQNKMSVK